MALFGRKKPPTEADTADSGEAKADFQPQPEKARVWFNHAKVAADAHNYAYALHCYASGIKLDPATISAHEAMYNAAAKYFNNGGKAASSKEIRAIEGPTTVERFAAAEYAWMKDLNNLSLAMKLLEAIAKAEQWEFGRWIAPRVLNMLRKQKKPSKSSYIQAKDRFAAIGAWDEALAAGQSGLALDPTDGDLDSELKSISAQRAMDAGGYEQTAGEEGGYRSFIRDADKQRELEEAESISAGESTQQRNLQRAKKAYEENPADVDALNKYAQLLKAQNSAEDEEKAYEIYMAGYEQTREYRFRMAAGDIRIAQTKRIVDNAKAATEENPDDARAQQRLDEALETYRSLRQKEYAARAQQYPTDRKIKHGLGRIEFELGNYEEAMGAFQVAKDDPKLRVSAGHMLGLCFAREGWHQEATDELKESLNAIDATNREQELPIRYDLMASLIERSKDEGSVEYAREALEICSTIARKDITYRDIRAKRKELDSLIKELTGGEGE